MNFIHPYLLFGLLLAGVPVLLHLLMRQKPKRLPFPAFRFLKQRFRTNQRKLNLQNLLLLLFRIAVIFAVCLALARPRLFADRLGGGSDRAVIAVLLFDISPSMEYSVGGVSRLDEAKRKAKELLDEMHSDSRVYLVWGDELQDAPLSPTAVRAQIDALKIQPGTGALNRPIDQALKLLGRQDAGEETPPRLLCVFTDRTRAMWDEVGVKPPVPEGVRAVVVDVGVDKPRDLGIERVEVIPPVVAPGTRYEVRIRVRGTPDRHENQVTCQITGDPNPSETQPVDLKKGFTGDLIVFYPTAPEPPANGPADVPHQVTARLGTRDFLPINDSGYATFLVRRGRKLLTIVDNDSIKRPARDARTGKPLPFPSVASVWDAAIGAKGSFAVDYRSVDQAVTLTDKQLGDYPAICLFQADDVSLELWRKLANYVSNGGGLAIVPGGEEMGDPAKFNESGKNLLPAPLDRIVNAPEDKPVYWERFSGAHPLMAPFVAWSRGGYLDLERDDVRPYARRYWQLGNLPPQSSAILRYLDDKKNPALAERRLDQGRVVLFTNPLDGRKLADDKPLQWNNYIESFFVMVLIDRVCLYLAGESTPPELNFRSGIVPQVAIPAGFAGKLSLQGPGLPGADRKIDAPPGKMLAIPDAVQPGNYRLLDSKDNVVAGFSLNLPPLETDLTRVPIETLDAVLGKDSVFPTGKSVRLSEALTGASRPPLEMLPYLMMGLLLVLTVESLLANRFYRRTSEESAPGPETT